MSAACRRDAQAVGKAGSSSPWAVMRRLSAVVRVGQSAVGCEGNEGPRYMRPPPFTQTFSGCGRGSGCGAGEAGRVSAGPWSTARPSLLADLQLAMSRATSSGRLHRHRPLRGGGGGEGRHAARGDASAGQQRGSSSSVPLAAAHVRGGRVRCVVLRRDAADAGPGHGPVPRGGGGLRAGPRPCKLVKGFRTSRTPGRGM